ncbi:MAG: WecB/TagA/CpsF family glycosyltransferase [Clostridia bacterium]|nr:WecB/TagA/CpsF family glycosyltransferase [Clostridia bacterium]
MNTTEKLNKINKNLLIVFFMIQPILELILSLFKDNSFQIAGISIATLIRYGLLSVIIGIAVITHLKRKSTKIFIGTVLVYAIYVIVHYLNSKSGNQTFLERMVNHGFVGMAMYISKFVIPICVVYLVYILRFNYKDLKICVLFVATFSALVVIITNVFGIDFVSYSFGDDTSNVAANIFKWFDKDYTYTEWRMLTSRGWFPSGNELSSFFAILLPIVTWIALKEKKNWYFAIIVIQMIAMLLVGTRISVYGAIILPIVTIIIWLLDNFLNKEKIQKRKLFCSAVVAVVFGIFFIASPFMNRIRIGEGVVNKFQQEKKDDEIELSEDDNTPERIFVKMNYAKELIPEDILYNGYNYLEHTDFWVRIITEVDIADRDNARKLKTLVLDDVEKEKSGKLDKLVGIGEMAVYPERDFVAQYYYIGLLGIILFLVPFAIVLIISGGYNFIKLLKKQLDGLQIVMLFSLVFIVGTAYLAGHVVEPVYINSIIGLISGMLMLLLVQRKEKNEFDKAGVEKYISKVYAQGEESFISELEEHVKENKKTFIVTANPETLMIANSNEEFDKCLMDEKTIIVPDGIGVVKGAKMLNYDLKETITGVGLCKKLFELGNENEKSIYLFGAKDEVVKKLKETLEKDYPKLKIAGIENGYAPNKQEVFDKIKKLKPDIVLVALGIPAQELLIHSNYDSFEKGIFMGVGGSFDVLSGSKKRAPEFFVKTHLEWLYRITTEPKRLGRFLRSNVRYVFKIISER